MSVWFGVWYGGNGFSLSDIEADMERFGSLEDAKGALYDRCWEGSSRNRFEYVNREPENVMTPAVGEDTCIHLYAVPDGDPALPDRRVYFGPRGGVRVERL